MAKRATGLGISWAGAVLMLATLPVTSRAGPVISEFLASNRAGIVDEDGDTSDWIEIHNPDPVSISLGGWFLTDSPANRMKWRFPEVILPPRGYLLIFASGKDRRDPTLQMHADFSLDAEGEYLALVPPEGGAPLTEFTPRFPPQRVDVSFGPAGSPPNGVAMYLERPTPGAGNSAAHPNGIAQTVTFSRGSGPANTAFELTLTGAAPGQVIRYVLAPASEGAGLSDPDIAAPRYSEPIMINGPTLVKAAVFSMDGSSRGPARAVHYSRIGSSLAGATSGLPVLVIDSLGSGPLVKDGLERPAWLSSYSPRPAGTQVFSAPPELTSPLLIHVRGSSSAEFPKKSYSLSFTDQFGDGDAPAWIDLGAHEKWVLGAPWFYDLNFINNAYVYALSNRLGRWAPRTRLAELYLSTDGGEIDAADYAGIHVITDRIEVAAKRVDIDVLRKEELTGIDVTGGYILKIDPAEPGEISWTTRGGYPETPGSSLVLVAPAAHEAAAEQVVHLKDYVQRMEDALVASRDSGWKQRPYLDFIDRASWVDQHLLQVFTANPDALVRSTYFTKDRGGRLVAGPAWDFDRALGSRRDERSFWPDIWFGVGATDAWQTGWWRLLTRDPEFMQDWIDRWQGLRRSRLATSELVQLVAELTAAVGSAADRDAARWPENLSPEGGYAGQLGQLKDWIRARADWIDRQFTLPPLVNAAGDNVVFTAPAGAELVYTMDGSDPRSLGGLLAPNARRSTAALTVPASTNVAVRSYAATSEGVFPGSPWSSAVGGPSSTPIGTASRVVNMSCRAVVGRGEDALIIGLAIADTTAKRYLLRGAGPALSAFGLNDGVREPAVTLFREGRLIATNAGWGNGPDAAVLPGLAKSVGAFPLPIGSRDSALISELAAGAYTLHVTSAATEPGIGLAEVYELDALGRCVNLSARARVSSGSGALFGGFVVRGTSVKRMLVRAAGPALAAFGLSGFLREPMLTVYDSRQGAVATNAGWGGADAATLAAAARIVGAFEFPLGSNDAALLISVAPGAYTVEVKGKDATEGVALLEIYDVP